jgi:hypothetical protein
MDYVGRSPEPLKKDQSRLAPLLQDTNGRG